MGKDGEEGKTLGCWGSGIGGWERKRIAVGKRFLKEKGPLSLIPS